MINYNTLRAGVVTTTLLLYGCGPEVADRPPQRDYAADAGFPEAVHTGDPDLLDQPVASASAQRVVAVGGPCINTLATRLLDNDAGCLDAGDAGTP